MTAVQDQWISAGLALICSPSNPKPLAELLRSGRPIPADTRDMLAELLDPQKPHYLHCCLELRDTQTNKRGFSSDENSMEIAAEFSRKMADGTSDGKSVEEAEEEAGNKFNINERTVRRHKKHVTELRHRLIGDK